MIEPIEVLLGVFVGIVIGVGVFAIGDEQWANARDTMMADCVKTQTYNACIEKWRGSKREP